MSTEKKPWSNKGNQDREMHDATCSKCGRDTKVPFVPDPNRKVFCQSCYKEIKEQRG